MNLISIKNAREMIFLFSLENIKKPNAVYAVKQSF